MDTKTVYFRGYRTKTYSNSNKYQRTYRACFRCWCCDGEKAVNDAFFSLEVLAKLIRGETVEYRHGDHRGWGRGWTEKISLATLRDDAAKFQGMSGDYICGDCWEILRKGRPTLHAMREDIFKRAAKDNKLNAWLRKNPPDNSRAVLKLCETCPPKIAIKAQALFS